ncbi:hypothetical protein BDZ94DRAFT_1315579 [Collybia nuda]|uniref:Uncharacterized protein n=1 Tax=Collybia nuda TaxID=64659 RepID=A0A9P6C8J1_9AGAR|nr:hypothetical protein BDZ94DRAFT_1315579 [Collybia nuda]
MAPRQTLFHKPSNNIFPNGWKTELAHDYFISYLTPYYTAASKASARKEFLERVYPIWFDWFPVTIESHSKDLVINSASKDLEEIEELQWAITCQKKFLARKLFWSGACKTTPPEDHWEDVLTLEADHIYRRNKYYACQKLGIHLNEYQYLNTIEVEADMLPQPVENGQKP